MARCFPRLFCWRRKKKEIKDKSAENVSAAVREISSERAKKKKKNVSNSAGGTAVVGPTRTRPSSSTVSSEWEKTVVVSQDGRATMEAEILFAGFDQFDDKVRGEGACSVLSVTLATWMAVHGDSIFPAQTFNDLIIQGAREWRRMREDPHSRFLDGHFDVETALTARTSQLVANPSKSFIGLIKLDYQEQRFSTQTLGMLSFDEIWVGIGEVVERSSGPVYYVLTWNNHLFLLRADKTEYHLIETLGSRLNEENNRAHIISFSDATTIKGNEVGIITGTACCLVYLQQFIVSRFLGDHEKEVGMVQQNDDAAFRRYLQKYQVECTFIERPAEPSTRPGNLLDRVAPATRPVIVQARPAKPSTRPGIFLDRAVPATRPFIVQNRPAEPATRPGIRIDRGAPATRPVIVDNRPSEPATRPGIRIDRAAPATRPVIVDNRPVEPATRPGIRIGRAAPSTRPVIVDNRPAEPATRPGIRIGRAAPSIRPVIVDNSPAAPARHVPIEATTIGDVQLVVSSSAALSTEGRPEEPHATGGNKILFVLKSVTLLILFLVLCLLVMAKLPSLIRTLHQCEKPSPEADSIHHGARKEIPREDERTGDLRLTVNTRGKVANRPALQGGAHLCRIEWVPGEEDDDDGTTNGKFDREEKEESNREKVCTFTSSGSKFTEHRVVYSRSSRFFFDCCAGGACGTSCQCSKPRKFTSQSRSSAVLMPGTDTGFPSSLRYAIEDVDSGSGLDDEVASDQCNFEEYKEMFEPVLERDGSHFDNFSRARKEWAELCDCMRRTANWTCPWEFIRSETKYWRTPVSQCSSYWTCCAEFFPSRTS